MIVIIIFIITIIIICRELDFEQPPLREPGLLGLVCSETISWLGRKRYATTMADEDDADDDGPVYR